MMNQEVVEMRNANQFCKAALRIGIRGSGLKHTVLPLMRANQKTARLYGTLQLLPSKQVTAGMLIAKKSKSVICP
jgi:hypothetical protein